MTLSPAPALVVAAPRRSWVRLDAADSAALRYITVVAFTIAPGLRLARLAHHASPLAFPRVGGWFRHLRVARRPETIHWASPPYSHIGACRAHRHAPNNRGSAAPGPQCAQEQKKINCNCRFRSYDLWVMGQTFPCFRNTALPMRSLRRDLRQVARDNSFLSFCGFTKKALRKPGAGGGRAMAGAN